MNMTFYLLKWTESSIRTLRHIELEFSVMWVRVWNEFDNRSWKNNASSCFDQKG